MAFGSGAFGRGAFGGSVESAAGGLSDLNNREELEAWLREQPREVSVAIAARAALRAVPVLTSELEQAERMPWDVSTALILPVFRAAAVSWVATIWATDRIGLASRAAAEAAGEAAAAADVTAATHAPTRGAYIADAAAHAAYTADASYAPDAPVTYSADSAPQAAAAAAARSADGAAVGATATAADVSQIAAGISAADLAAAPVWPEGIPDEIAGLWAKLKQTLLSLDEGWEVWTDWYEARLEGRPADEALEVARATIPDEIWRQGPKPVNAHIRELIARHGGESPDASGATPTSEATVEVPSATAEVTSGAPTVVATGPRPAAWLAQFTQDRDWVSQWTKEARPGSEIPWKVGRADIGAMRAGDPVVYWRTITKGRDEGGIVGTGRVVSPEPVTDDAGGLRVRTEVVEFFDDAPLDRRDVISRTALKPDHWRFSLYRLPADVAKRMDALLRARGREGIDDQPQPPPPRARHEVEYVSDRPETARDLLGRAPLAFALSAQINRIWEAQTQGEPQVSRWRRLCDALHITRAARPAAQPDEAAFILHIDAPWGGGKTTFANFIGRILNPAAFGLDASAEGAALLDSLPLDDPSLWKPAYRKRRWHVVTFNAWQHEHVSPPWWNFYEVIRRQCLRSLVKSGPEAQPKEASWWQRLWSGAKDRLKTRSRWLWYGLREYLWRIWSPATRRAVVTTLLLGALMFLVYRFGLPGRLETLEIAEVKITTLAALFASGGIGVLIFNAIRSGLSTFVESVSSSADAATLGEADPLYRFQNHFSWFVRQLGEPVLVVVDDLDRCKPEYVVELVRGLLTIFRSPRVVFLLLGDKAWIEAAFAHVHADMQKAHSDGQISFGGRFAEKAIQLSFILPEATEAERNDFLVAVLTGRLPIAGTGDGRALAEGAVSSEDTGAPASRQPGLSHQLENDLKEFGRAVRQRFRTALDTDELVQAKAATRAEIGQLFKRTGDGTATDLAKRFQEAAERTVEVEASFRSSTSDKTEDDIRHGIEPVAPFLPGNPRRIKRIVNMVSAFQESGQIAEMIDPLSRKWRQLVLWTVIMSEYPRGWRTLVLEEEVARELIGLVGTADPEGTVKLPPLKKSATEEEKARRAAVAELASCQGLVRLLRGDPYNEPEPGGDNHAVDDATLAWLRRLTPLG